jgi:hypothetical protein
MTHTSPESPDRSELSKLAYESLPSAKSQRRILPVLQEHGPLTANAIEKFLPPSVCHNVRARLKELEENGWVLGSERVTDPISGKLVTLWRLRLPGEIQPVEKSRESRASLQKRVERLERLAMQLDFQVKELKGRAAK